MKAWNTVHRQFKDAELLVLGRGKTNGLISLLDQAAKHSVVFKGHVPHEILLKELNEATLAVFPSYSETFGLGVAEAMSTGCPVIYTRRSCGPEIVGDEKEGLLADPDNIAELSDCILKLLTNEALRTRLGAAGQLSVNERFAIAPIAAQHVSFYKQVISDFRPL